MISSLSAHFIILKVVSLSMERMCPSPVSSKAAADSRSYTTYPLSVSEDENDLALPSAKALQEMSIEERASLLQRGSPAGADTSFASSELEENEDEWEIIPPQTTRSWSSLWYWTTRSVPILLFDAIRLGLFVVFLAPAFASFFWYYFTCDRKVVRYKQDSNSIRHAADLYGASTGSDEGRQAGAKKPVLIFFTGGAWVIGYKMWGAFLAKVFAAMGVLVVVPDYPNYPFVTVPDMVEDVEVAIQWILENIEQYGGDAERVLLAGQSAGGHLASCVLLRKALQQLQGSACTGFQPNQLAGFCSISAPSDVQAMATNFQKHGLDQAFVQSLFGCNSVRKTCIDDYDPQRLADQLQEIVAKEEGIGDELSLILPPMSIFHGTADQTVPYEVSEKYAASLQQAGIITEYIAYEGWSHTDPILEAIMMADHRFHADLYDRLYQWTAKSSSGNDNADTYHSGSNHNNRRVIPLQLDDSIRECQPLCPTFLVQAARFVNPF